MAGSHVLLDLDGTISDSSLGIGRSLRYAFSACGYPEPTDEEIRSMIGPPFEITFPALGVPAPDVARVVSFYTERYEDVGLFENTVYDGIGEMLDDLRSAGHTISLATAKPEHTAIRIIEHFGFTDYFALQAGATAVVGSARRTKGEVITYALGILGVTPRHMDSDGNDVVMVGDRDHDVQGASRNEIPCIGVTWGFGTVDELTHAGAAAIVDSPDQVAASVAATYRSVRR